MLFPKKLEYFIFLDKLMTVQCFINVSEILSLIFLLDWLACKRSF